MTHFDYLLNAFEAASQSDSPAKEGYAEKRRALFAYVRELEERRLDAERYRWLRCAGDAAQALRNLRAELETEESRRHEVVRERNALRDELAVERKRVGSYRTLVFSLESQISRHRANASEAAEAIRTLDSEREANATLTAELAECNARPDCRTCDHCSPDYVCRLMCRTPIVCINGDAYTPTESVRLYEAKARKGEEEGDGHAAR